MTFRSYVASVAALAFLLLAGRASAEPMFLSRQYNRCRTCHYSATGGGLLTPYGRGLSARELSARVDPTTDPESPGEGAALYRPLGDRLGALELGADVRPSLRQR